MIQPIHILQLVLAAAAIGVVVERVRVLLFRAPVDSGPYLAALDRAVADGDTDEAKALVSAGAPAWVPEVAGLCLEGDALGALERATDLRFEATQRLYALRVFASLGTALGFLGALVELIWLMSGDHGLLALQAGLVERIAMERAILAMALGVAISVFSLVSLSILKKAALGLIRDMERAHEMFETRGEYVQPGGPQP